MPNTVTHHVWDSMPRERVNDLLERRYVSGQRMMLAHVYLKKGCLVPMHQHDNEQLTYILEGALEFTPGPDPSPQQVVPAGNGVVISATVP